MEDLKLKENEVVHCKTEKQANKVLKIAYKLGCEWQVQSLGNRFYDCKENTVYHLDNIITYSDLEYCKGKELKVITAKEFLKRHKETKKGKLTIIVSKNYKDLYEDNLALVNHILLDTVRCDFEWIERVQKSNLNITLYTDKNDTELFKNSFGKFEVKLMDCEVNTSPLGKTAIVRKEELTLENIQVDCSELTSEQIENMKRVVVDNGFKLYEGEDWIVFGSVKYFLTNNICDLDGFYITGKYENKTTITYENFMELFDTKIVMDNGNTISNAKEGVAKSIEELHVEHKEQSFNKIKEEEFYKGLELKLNPKGLCVEWMEEFNKIPGHVFDALKFRTPQEQEMLKVDYNQISTNHNLKPKQYQIGIDTFERAKANLTTKEYLACLKFGIDKYTWREKDQDIEDFEKIIAYSNEAINVLKSKK